MGLIETLNTIDKIKFAFGKKAAQLYLFSTQIKALSMFDSGYGLGISPAISPGNQILSIFAEINARGGIFIFNISGVDILKARAGFTSFEEAFDNNMITEWELSVILGNEDYLKITIFHNGKVELPQIKNGLQLTWN